MLNYSAGVVNHTGFDAMATFLGNVVRTLRVGRQELGESEASFWHCCCCRKVSGDMCFFEEKQVLKAILGTILGSSD
jgi:hypothetical protein